MLKHVKSGPARHTGVVQVRRLMVCGDSFEVAYAKKGDTGQASGRFLRFFFNVVLPVLVHGTKIAILEQLCQRHPRVMTPLSSMGSVSNVSSNSPRDIVVHLPRGAAPATTARSRASLRGQHCFAIHQEQISTTTTSTNHSIGTWCVRKSLASHLVSACSRVRNLPFVDSK